ncbi:MAG: hypothetical protein ACI383_03265 [Rummeliibacillus sp.]
MEKIDQSLDKIPISIFDNTVQQVHLRKTMRDIVSLSGVLNDLHSQQIYQTPIEILRFLKILKLLNEEALGLTRTIETEEELFYRYIHYFHDGEPPSLEKVIQICNTLAKHNWISKQKKKLKLLDRGKRMIDMLIRMANDSLAYHMQDDLFRPLFQAIRDAELSEAYDDCGISGEHKIASMIRNVEVAIEQIELHQLELLAEKNALPRIEKLYSLMREIDDKMNARLKQCKSVDEAMHSLMKRGAAAFTKGTDLSLGLLNKYNRFVMMKNSPITTSISPEKVRQFIVNMYEPPVDSNIPNGHEIFSFMEQQEYDDEGIDGLWIPIKFTSPISRLDIEEGIDYLENYEPQANVEDIEKVPIQYVEEIIEKANARDIFSEVSWQMTKSDIKTEEVEEFLEGKKDVELEQLIVQSGSNNWGDSIRTLLAVSALIGNQNVEENRKEDVQTIEKEWEWSNDDDRKYSIRQRTAKPKSFDGDAES